MEIKYLGEKTRNIAHLLSQNPITAPRRIVKWLKDQENSAAAFNEIFVQQPYYELYKNIKPDTTVIDMGAFIGDSAIYFAMNQNVKRVISFEIIPKTYNTAKNNIAQNPFHDKIELHNKAIGKDEGSLFVVEDHVGDMRDKIESAKSKKGKEVEVIKLSSVLDGLTNVAIKADIEGQEAFIFHSADLKNVYAVILEYHNTKEEVIKTLRAKGFKIKDLNPDRTQGHLYAYKS